MKKQIVAVFCAGLVSLSMAAPTQAALVANGDFTTDTDTGLDWLDFDLSLGLSLNQVNAQLGAGGLFEGYQVATLEQAQTFLTNAGWIGAFDSSNNLNTNFVANFKSQTTSLTNDPAGSINALYNDPLFDLGIMGFLDDPAGSLGCFSCYSQNGSVNPDFSDQNTGTFLLRATVVPVPAAVWLFGTGFICLIGFAKRRAT